MIRVFVPILHQNDYLTAWFSALKSQEVEKQSVMFFNFLHD